MWPLWGRRFLPENLAVVCACVQAIAGGIASLPCRVYQTVDGKRVERPDHPVARLIRQPNSLQSWPDFIEWVVASALLQGNGLAVIDHDQRGAPTGLYPIPWWCCQALLVPSAPAEAIGSPYIPNSRLVFDITQTQMPWPLPSSGYYPRPASPGAISRTRCSFCATAAMTGSLAARASAAPPRRWRRA
jgi:hypothetical protein